MRKKTAEELRKLMELRRSNAATPIPNKKNKYNRQSNKKMIELETKERNP